MSEDFVAATQWLRARPESSGRLGTIGFCFGGGVANRLAVRLPQVNAVVAFYGQPPPAADVPRMRAAVDAPCASTANGGASAVPASAAPANKTPRRKVLPP